MDAQQLYNRIGTGKENAVQRPPDSSTDRKLRKMIESSNTQGDCIIASKYGYYRPDIHRADELREAHKVIAMELHRARSILHKRKNMKLTLERWEETQTWPRKAEIKGHEENESLPNYYLDTDTLAEGDSNIAGQMVLRML